jgi:peptidoglycan/xylan/chitin deacetylase (PgdA/CDA1 family)
MLRLPRVPKWVNWIYPQMEWKSRNGGLVLTFDDGPHPEITPWVLNELAQRNLKATFFLVGDNARKYPEVVALIKQHNHQIGNHTFHHVKGTDTDTKTYLEEVDIAAPLTSSNLFRPPYGRITREQMRGVLEKGYRVIMWEVLSYDFDEALQADDCMKLLKKATGENSIVVFHDSEKAWNRLQHVLPAYLDWIVEKGFRVGEL